MDPLWTATDLFVAFTSSLFTVLLFVLGAACILRLVLPLAVRPFGYRLVRDCPFMIDMQPGEGVVLWLVGWKIRRRNHSADSC